MPRCCASFLRQPPRGGRHSYLDHSCLGSLYHRATLTTPQGSSSQCPTGGHSRGPWLLILDLASSRARVSRQPRGSGFSEAPRKVVGWGEPDADERRAEFPEAALASAGQEEAEGERRVGPVWNQLSHRPCLCREWGPRSPSPTFPCSASLFSRSARPVASFPCLGFFPLGNLLPPRALLHPPYLKRLQSGRPPKHSNKAARHARPPSRASGRPRHAGVAENSPRAPATDRQGERDDGDGRSSALWLSFPEENEANAASSSGGATPAGSGSRQLSIPVRNVPAGSP